MKFSHSVVVIAILCISLAPLAQALPPSPQPQAQPQQAQACAPAQAQAQARGQLQAQAPMALGRRGCVVRALAQLLYENGDRLGTRFDSVLPALLGLADVSAADLDARWVGDEWVGEWVGKIVFVDTGTKYTRCSSYGMISS